MCFDIPYEIIVDVKRKKAILIKTTDHEKTHFTVVMARMPNGNKLPPMAIFKCK